MKIENLDNSWNKLLEEEFSKEYFTELKNFLDEEKKNGKIIYPREEDIFQAFNMTPFEDVKVVIIGQDPYHGEGQAHGMCFSVKPGVKPPPSLVNIFKELKSDLDIQTPDHGYLIQWAKQGVLLINSVLTVEKSLAGSHHKKGWEKFTDKVIDLINEEKKDVVFILWGAPAQKKAKRVDEKKHYIISSPHPSPLAAYRGFFGSKPFSKANEHLINIGKAPIDWSL